MVTNKPAATAEDKALWNWWAKRLLEYEQHMDKLEITDAITSGTRWPAPTNNIDSSAPWVLAGTQLQAGPAASGNGQPGGSPGLLRF